MRLFGKKRPDVWKLKREMDVGGLIEVLGNRDLDEEDRVSAADRLGELNDLKAVDALSLALVNEVARVRWAAARALWHIDGARVQIEMLTTALNDPEEEGCRSYAVEALGKSHDQRAFDPLVAALCTSPHRLLRRQAVSALAKLGDPRAVDVLSQALENEDYVIRQHATQKLIELNATLVVERLVTSLSDDAVRKGVEESLLYPGEQAREGFAPVFAALREAAPTEETPGQALSAELSASEKPASIKVGQTWRDVDGNEYLVVSATEGVSYRLQFVSGTEKPGWSLGSQISIYEPGELLDAPSWSFVSGPPGSLGVFEACRAGDVGSVRELLEGDADLTNSREAGDIRPLHVAATEGHGAVVSLLLEYGAEVDARNDYGVTPLYLASASGHGEVVALLLAAGADQTVADETGESPLAAAARKGHEDVVGLLQDGGTDTSTETTTSSEAASVGASGGDGKSGSRIERGGESMSLTSDDVFRLEDDGDADALLEILATTDETKVTSSVRSAAGHALARMGEQRAVPLLIKRLSERFDWDDAARALGVLRDGRAVKPLVAALKNKRGNTHVVAEALGKIGDPSAVPALIRAMKVELDLPLFQRTSTPAYDTTLRSAAIEALGEIGDPSATDALREALSDEHDFIVRRAEEALAKLSSPEAQAAAGPAIAKRQQEWEEQAVGRVRLLDEGWERHLPALTGFDLVTQREGGSEGFGSWRVSEDGCLYVDGMAGTPRACQQHTSPMDDLNAVSRGRYMELSPDDLLVLYAILLGHQFVDHVVGTARENELLAYAAGVLGGCAGSFAHALRHFERAHGEAIPRFHEMILDASALDTWRNEIRTHLDDAESRFPQFRSLYEMVLSTWMGGAVA